MTLSVMAYITYGERTDTNIIQNLPKGNFQLYWYAYVLRAGMILVCMGVYPLMLLPMAAPVKNK